MPQIHPAYRTPPPSFTPNPALDHDPILRRRWLTRAGALTLTGALGLHRVARAESWPTRPVRMVVPSAPGGSTDLSARLVGEPMAQALGQPVVIENRPGAAGNLGTGLVARAEPDGLTLLMQYSGYHVGNPALFKELDWDPVRDFAPVALVMRAPHVIAVGGRLNVRTIDELIALGKKRPLLYASSGYGSIQHIAGAMLGSRLGVPVVHVPYKGSGPVMTDLMSGQVDLFITTPAPVVGHLASGKLRALAYTATERHPALPDVPTSAEAGLPGYEVDSWFGVFAPARTPADRVERIAGILKSIVASPTYRSRMNEQASLPVWLGPKAFAEVVQSDRKRWARIIEQEAIRIE